TASLQKQNGANTITIVGREPLNIEIHCCPPLGLLFYFSRFSFLKASFDNEILPLNFRFMKLL
ncbi:hypothetical protein P3389_30155, partial [Vibrio parahaemolyticus]|nr:hypothetical protein [Vibrio parahaemolyticus]